MKLTTIFIVRDPGPLSEIEDICYEVAVSHLDDYIIGGGTGTWRHENTVVYTTAAEALADASTRLIARNLPLCPRSGVE